MTKCPQCNVNLDFDFLDSLMTDLSSAPLRNEIILNAPCCGEQLQSTADAGMYYLVSHPQKESEKKVMIGAN